MDLDSIDNLEKAWSLITDQYFEYTKNSCRGSGLHIFRMLRSSKSDGSNCEYYFAQEDGEVWKDVLNNSPEKRAIINKYNPSLSLLISVQVPTGISGDNTIGDVRLFSFETGIEIFLEDESDEDDLVIAESSNGLRKRKTICE